jgi:hypothetical protein
MKTILFLLCLAAAVETRGATVPPQPRTPTIIVDTRDLYPDAPETCWRRVFRFLRVRFLP